MEAAQVSGATPNWPALTGSGNGLLWCGKGGAKQSLCQRCEGILFDIAEHVNFGFAVLEAERSLFAS